MPSWSKNLSLALLLATAVISSSQAAEKSALVRRSADADPQDLFRDNVNPADGGKVPESAHLRVELNKIDSAGLKDPHALQRVQALKDTPLPEKVAAPGYDYPHPSHSPYGGFHPGPAPAYGPAHYDYGHPGSLEYADYDDDPPPSAAQTTLPKAPVVDIGDAFDGIETGQFPFGVNFDWLRLPKKGRGEEEADDYSQTLEPTFSHAGEGPDDHAYYDYYYEDSAPPPPAPVAAASPKPKRDTARRPPPPPLSPSEQSLFPDFDSPSSYAFEPKQNSPKYGNFLDKPHLFTVDPYAKHPPAHGYKPSTYAPAPAPAYAPAPAPAYHEPAPYQPPAYHPPAHDAYEPVHHDPYVPAHADPYKPPVHHAPPAPHHDAYAPPAPHHDAYHPPAPHHDAYAPPPHSDYHEPAPYKKPIGPILLDKQPYEVKEIKPLAVPLHDTYTSFDCRKVPYPDRHYADPDTGCSEYHFCHSDGRMETFHCPYGTIFNEYLGTCDHSEAVYCSGKTGKGYEPPKAKPHYGHAAGYTKPEPYHDPYHDPYHGKSHHEPGYHAPTPAPYHEPAYHAPSPAPYHEPGPYHAPASPPAYSHPTYQPAYEPHFDFPKTVPGFQGSF